MRAIAGASVDHGWRVPAVKWIMLSSVFTGGVGFYAFYALQPYLLELSGHPEAYGIAGLVAAIVAGSEIVGRDCRPLDPQALPPPDLRSAHRRGRRHRRRSG